MQRIKFSFTSLSLVSASIFTTALGIGSVRIKSGSCPAASHQTCRRVDFGFTSLKLIDSNDQRLFKSLKRTFKCNKGRILFKQSTAAPFIFWSGYCFGFAPPKKTYQRSRHGCILKFLVCLTKDLFGKIFLKPGYILGCFLGICASDRSSIYLSWSPVQMLK